MVGGRETAGLRGFSKALSRPLDEHVISSLVEIADKFAAKRRPRPPINVTHPPIHRCPPDRYCNSGIYIEDFRSSLIYLGMHSRTSEPIYWPVSSVVGGGYWPVYFGRSSLGQTGDATARCQGVATV